MRKSRFTRIVSPLLIALVLLSTVSVTGQQQIDEDKLYRLVNQIRKKILGLSNYSVFDFITFGLKGGENGVIVVLQGYAARPTLKDSAGRVVKRLKLVEDVENNIEVLPVGGNDEDIRLKVYRAIYFHSFLSRYNPNRGTPMYGPGGMGGSAFSNDPFGSPTGGLWARNQAFGISNDPPLGYHPMSIIVKRGHVTLEGVIDTESDLALVNAQVNSVPGIFSVTNNLQVLNPKKKK